MPKELLARVGLGHRGGVSNVCAQWEVEPNWEEKGAGQQLGIRVEGWLTQLGHIAMQNSEEPKKPECKPGLPGFYKINLSG